MDSDFKLVLLRNVNNLW